MATEQEILDKIPAMEAKRDASLERAAEKRAKGREDQAVAWDASAARWANLIEITKRLAQTAANVAAIKARLADRGKPPAGGSGDPGQWSGGGGGGGGGAPAPEPEPAPAPKPPPPPPPPPEPGVPAIKTAPIDTVIFNDELVDKDIIADLLFEDIGGQEILTILRYDTVNGQEVSYQPIKNLNLIQQEYNPNNLVRLQATSDRIFANFPIKLGDKIPVEGNGPNGENIYLDSSGSIVIEFINLLGDEQVEIQIASSGTIYEAEI